MKLSNNERMMDYGWCMGKLSLSKQALIDVSSQFVITENPELREKVLSALSRLHTVYDELEKEYNAQRKAV